MVIAPAPSRIIVKQLKDGGFTKRDGRGSHTVWTCRHGRVEVSVTTGHKAISPGVRRQVDNAIRLCQKKCEEA